MLAGFAAIAEPYRIVGLGDSLMAGYGLNPGESFPEKLQAALKASGHDIEVINAGVSGDTSSGGLSRLDWSVPDGARLVILELGANDMLRGITPEITEKNLDAMLARLQAAAHRRARRRHARGAQSGRGLPGGVRFDFPRLAEKYGAALYPFFLDGVAAEPGLLQQDGMHPSAKGVDVMIERILPLVESLLAANPDNS